MAKQLRQVDPFQFDYARGLMLPTKRLFLPRNQNKLQPGCCGCGGTTCALFSDNFTRADSTSLGASWTEVQGNWEINTNTLRVTSAFLPAILVSASAPSQQNYSMTWTYLNAVSGTKFRGIYGYTNTSNYYYAELELTSSTTATIKLYSRSGGSDTLLSTSSSFTVVSGGGSLTMCYNGTLLSASTSGFTSSYVSYPISAPSGSALFGVGTPNPVTTSGIRFSLVEVSKAETGCEICRPGNCCATDETGPIPRQICCMFDEFGPPQTMQVDIDGSYDHDGAGTDDCPWCGSDPAEGSWIVTNTSGFTDPCAYVIPNPCSLIYDHGMVIGPDACIGGTYICVSRTFVNFLWVDVCSTYRIVCIQEYVLNVFGDDCTGTPCGSGASGTQWMRWYKDFTWPAGGISAASLSSISLDPDLTLLVGGQNTLCSYTGESCVVDFLT